MINNVLVEVCAEQGLQSEHGVTHGTLIYHLGLSCLHSWMLCVGMGVRSRRRLEGHGAERTFVEDLTVSTLDVGFYSCNISEDHTTVDTAVADSTGVMQAVLGDM